MFKVSLIALLGLALSFGCSASDDRFTVIAVDTTHERLELFLNDEAGRPFNRFDRLVSWLKAGNKQLKFATNAGMFHANFSPVGLFVSNEKQVSPLNLANGSGNFFLKPNGVFLVANSGPRIVESSEYPAVSSGVRIATQSGPLLVRHGVIHSAFSPTSTSRLIRNGVGVAGSKVFFVISERPVTFHELAIFFRDSLRCEDALYLDGVVSGIFSAEIGRNDRRANLGPILGILK
jgi:uncharacterized protein YigE (DUF2233 family)